jgi:hypothetical protein
MGGIRRGDLSPAFGGSTPWIYDRIHKGTIQVAKDRQRQLFLFPDRPETLAQLQQLRDGTLQTVCFGPDEPCV